MIAPLDKKLLRDLASIWGQALMIALVVAAGVATLINSQTMLFSLETTRTSFYDRYYFADVFASTKRAPESLAQRIKDIPGVAKVQTRVVRMVTLDVPGLDEPAVAQLISTPVSHPPVLNQIYLRRGRLLAPGRNDEVLASEKFVEANGLRVGDTVSAVINERQKDLRIVGVVLSPEYVFQVKPGDLVPDPIHYGVFWMNRDALEMAFDMEGAFNDVSLKLMQGASEEDAIQRLDQLLAPYGGLGAYGRQDQISHMLLEGDIDGLKTTGLILPSLFLAVASFLINVVLARLLALQREQIAALKAFGYSNLGIASHYLKFVLVIILVGGALGAAGGMYLGHAFTELIASVYQYPELIIRARPQVIAAALGVAAGAAFLGAAGAVLSAVRVPPAEAMRPEPPANYKPTIIERLGLGTWLPSAVRMVVRHIERRPWKSGLSILAIGLSVGIIVVGQYIRDSIDYTLEHQFFFVQRYDLVVNTFEAGSPDVINDLRHVPGVMRVEPVRMVAARLRFGPNQRKVALMGIEPDATLYQISDQTGALYKPPPGGIALSAVLGRSLGVEPGEEVRIEVLEGKQPVVQTKVVSLIEDLQGLNAYMELSALDRLMREGPRVSGAFLLTDPLLEHKTYETLKATPKVGGVTVKRSAIESFQETIAKNMGFMQRMNMTFACVIAVGVVYNSARIAQSERNRELATLRVIGFTRGEISAILLGELGLLTLLAMPVGWMLGYWFASGLNMLINSQEVVRFPLVVERSTYGIASGIVLIASLVSGLLVRRSLDHLDLIAVLKARD